MSGPILVAVVAAIPPTIAALLALVCARTAQREAGAERRSGLHEEIATMWVAALSRVETIVERTDYTVGGLREPVARFEGSSSPAAP